MTNIQLAYSANEQDRWYLWCALKDIQDELRAIQNGGGELGEGFRTQVLKEIEAIREILDK